MNRADLSSQELWVCHLGTIPYRDAVVMQERIRERRLAEELPDTLLLLEHPPVYTRGRRSADGELTLGEDFYRAQGIDVVDTDRGGRITYHGPGQLVGYPIMGIGAVDRYLRTIETALVTALEEEGIEARSRCDEGPDYTGVWVEDRKIASIGVHVSRGVSTHGFAVNVENDLEPFTWVVACGLPDVTMTSLALELRGDGEAGRGAGHAIGLADLDSVHCPGVAGRDGVHSPGVPALDASHSPALACVRKRVAHSFCRAHGRRQRLVSPRQLRIEAPVAAPRGEMAPV